MQLLGDHQVFRLKASILISCKVTIRAASVSGPVVRNLSMNVASTTIMGFTNKVQRYRAVHLPRGERVARELQDKLLNLKSRSLATFSYIKKTSTPSFLHFVLLLCILGTFATIVITSSFWMYTKEVFPAHNYRRTQLLVWDDMHHGGIMGLGSLKPKQVGQCPAGMEDFVPCYNLTANSEAGYSAGLEFERDCEVSKRKQCLIAPPKDYKILLKWPECLDGIWPGNLQINTRSNKNRFLIEGNRLKFPYEDPQLMVRIERYVDRIASSLDLESYKEFGNAKIRIVMDFGCGSSSLGGLLWFHEVVTICVAPYEEHGGQVQLSLELGLPAIIGSLAVTPLPYPSSAFDLINCAYNGVTFYAESGKPIIEVDRLLRPGGYFVWGKPFGEDEKAWEKMQNITASLCWDMISPSENEYLVIWQKNAFCFGSVVPVHNQPAWPSQMHIAALETVKKGPGKDEVTGGPRTWIAAVSEYWSLLTPIIFSDDPKRLRDEDVQLASVRNVMDLNAGIGAFNDALLQTGKAVWVMNVVPTSAPNTLRFVFDRGLFGVNHDWCEAFPTYPRTYDLLHAADLLSQEMRRPHSCGLSNIFLEMDRILRPEGWVILRDDVDLIEHARIVATQMRWLSRMTQVPGESQQRLLVCRKTFWKRH